MQIYVMCRKILCMLHPVPPNGSTIIQYHNQEIDAGAITASIQISLVLRVLICVCLYSTV